MEWTFMLILKHQLSGGRWSTNAPLTSHSSRQYRTHPPNHPPQRRRGGRNSPDLRDPILFHPWRPRFLSPPSIQITANMQQALLLPFHGGRGSGRMAQIWVQSTYFLYLRLCAAVVCTKEGCTMYSRPGLIAPSSSSKLLPVVLLFHLVYYLRKHLSLLYIFPCILHCEPKKITDTSKSIRNR